MKKNEYGVILKTSPLENPCEYCKYRDSETTEKPCVDCPDFIELDEYYKKD